jgi:hypothetical protein
MLYNFSSIPRQIKTYHSPKIPISFQTKSNFKRTNGCIKKTHQKFIPLVHSWVSRIGTLSGKVSSWQAPSDKLGPPIYHIRNMPQYRQLLRWSVCDQDLILDWIKICFQFGRLRVRLIFARIYFLNIIYLRISFGRICDRKMQLTNIWFWFAAQRWIYGIGILI